MTTCGDLLDECVAELHGWGATTDRITSLTSDIGPTDTTFTVDTVSGTAIGIAPGVVEIGNELLYVTAIDTNSGVCTVAHGFGRGYNGTTAQSHTAGSKIISRPRFPRTWLLKQLNEVLGAVFPDLFATATFTGTVTYPSNTYTLASTPIRVIAADWQDPVGNWHPCRSYTIDVYDGTFRLGGGVLIGRPLRVLYATEPTAFTSETDNFTATGLPASCSDVLTLGAVARVLPSLDISRAQTDRVEQSDRNRVVPPQSGVSAAKFVMAQYQDRLQNEAAALRRRYRTRKVATF